jgi:hypothetical protein
MGFMFSQGGGGGTAPPLANGLPTGGATGDALLKRSATDYDAIWAPNTPLFTFIGTPPMNVLGTEGSGVVVASYTIPATALPSIAFSWIVQSNGYGTFFGQNVGATGTPTGSYLFDVWDGAAFVQSASLSGAAFTAPDTLARAGGSGAGASRVFRYNPAVLNEIRFQLRVSSAPTSAFTLNVGLQGMIISFP